MTIKITNIQHKFRNKYIKYAAGTSDNISSVSSNNVENKFDNYFYEDDNGNLHSRLSFVGDKEISAYGVGDGSGSGSVTIIDNLLSTATDCALSANQGRVLNEKIEDIIEQSVGGVTSWNDLEDKPALLTDENIQKWNTQTHTHSNKTVLDAITSAKTTNWDSAYTHISDTTKHITSDERTSWNNKLDKSVWDKAFYYDSDNNLRVKVNVVGEKEISAYGIGESGGSGAITIVDNLTSTQTDCALSANQGRILKGLIDDKVSTWDDLEGKPSWIGSTKPSYSWSEITGKPSTFTPSEHTHNYTSTIKIGSTSYNVSANTVSLPAYPTLTDLGGVSTSTFNSHTGNTTLHITSTERTNWNTAYNNNHTHSNKSVLDGITSAKVGNWDTVYSNWNKAFYFDSNNNLRVKLNLVGEGEVSAYGAGTSGTGIITIVDNLTSTATDCALSANQGRVLKGLIDSKVSSWNDIKDKPSTFTPSSHTHNYASTVKVGSTNYNVNSNIISLPAYPTTLKNPNALTISLNGTSQGAYDGSAAKSINITASSIGAAASSHTHTISQITNLQSTLDSKLNSSAYTAADVLSKLKTVDGSGSGLNADLLDGLDWNSFDLQRTYIINLSSYSSSNFYPVIFNQEYRELNCWIQSPSAGGSAAYNCNRIHFLYSTNGWSDFGNSLTMLSRHNYQDNEITIGSIGRGQRGGGCIAVWLRGGLSYTFRCNRTPNLKTSNYTISEETYTVGTGLSGGANSNVDIIWTNDSNRAKYDLATISSNVASATNADKLDGVHLNGIFTALSSSSGTNLSATIGGVTKSIADLYATTAEKLTTNAGASNRPVYFANGVPVAGSYTFGNANGNAAINNGTLCTNLNADMVDGLHSISLTRSYNSGSHNVYMCLGTLTLPQNGYAARLYLVSGNGYNANETQSRVGMIILRTSNGNASGGKYYAGHVESYRYGMYNIYVVQNSSTSFTLWTDKTSYTGAGYISVDTTPTGTNFTSSTQTSSTLPSNSVKLPLYQVAYTDSNVASATKLQTARTIWGQSFNGTANVSGNMTGVGSISASGNIVAGGEITAYSDKRLKSNIQTLEDRGYITPVTYIKDGKQSIGFLAQEVREKYPELVTEDTNEEKYLSLNYAQYTAVLQAQIIELNNRIKQLESKL